MSSTEMQSNDTATEGAVVERLVSLFAELFTRANIESQEVLLANLQPNNIFLTESIFQFPQVRDITNDLSLIYRALTLSPNLEVDEGRVKLKMKSEQSTIILRELPADVTENDIKSVFEHSASLQDGTKCPQPQRINKVAIENQPDTWFVTFTSESDARTALLCIRGSKINNAPVKARLKTEISSRTYYSYTSPLSTPGTPSGDFFPAVPYNVLPVFPFPAPSPNMFMPPNGGMFPGNAAELGMHPWPGSPYGQNNFGYNRNQRNGQMRNNQRPKGSPRRDGYATQSTPNDQSGELQRSSDDQSPEAAIDVGEITNQNVSNNKQGYYGQNPDTTDMSTENYGRRYQQNNSQGNRRNDRAGGDQRRRNRDGNNQGDFNQSGNRNRNSDDRRNRQNGNNRKSGATKDENVSKPTAKFNLDVADFPAWIEGPSSSEKPKTGGKVGNWAAAVAGPGKTSSDEKKKSEVAKRSIELKPQ